MQKTGYDALKRMAQIAKNRLRSKVNEYDNKSIKSRGNFKILYGKDIDIKSKIISRDDTKLYQKVKSILEEDFDIVNPIAKLIDYKVYNKLSDLDKERYLFDIIEKYKYYKQKFQEERSAV